MTAASSLHSHLRALDGVRDVESDDTTVTVRFDVETYTIENILAAYRSVRFTVTTYDRRDADDDRGTHVMVGTHDPDDDLDDWRVNNGVQA